MSDALDSSVLVDAMIPAAQFHSECLTLLHRGGWSVYQHALAETFNTLSGGKLGFRIPAETAYDMLNTRIMPFVSSVILAENEVLDALAETRLRGVRGAIVFDYFHLVAAKKATAVRFYTLNISDFRHFHRSGDPEIAHP